MADFTPTQGRYLEFILNYTKKYGIPPAESDIGKALCVSPPSVNQMVRNLEKLGLILRQPGQARSIRLLVPEDEISPKKRSAKSNRTAKNSVTITVTPSPPANLYVLTAFLYRGPLGGKYQNKRYMRIIEIRGDQTLDDLHHCLFKAFDRTEDKPYEYHLGSRAFDPEAPRYGVPPSKKGKPLDARAATLDSLDFKPERVFGYCFDSKGDQWYHHVQVDKIEEAIPTVTYPRVTKRLGKSPPQFGG